MAEVFQRPAARRDLIEHYVYLAENAGETVADRFLTRAPESFSQLLEQPLMGSPLDSDRPELAGLRKWRVSDFEDILIFISRMIAGSRSSARCAAHGTGGIYWVSHRQAYRADSTRLPGPAPSSN